MLVDVRGCEKAVHETEKRNTAISFTDEPNIRVSSLESFLLFIPNNSPSTHR